MIVFYIILSVIALPFVLALFVKKEYTIERSIDIERPKAEVFDYIRYVKNTGNFSVWVMADPDSKRDYSGTDGAVGFVFKWNSKDNQVGEGEQEIVLIEDGQKIEFEIRFIRPFKGKAVSFMETTAVSENTTRVRWVFRNVMNYPMNIAGLFLNFDKLLGKDQETSLRNLKQILEK